MTLNTLKIASRGPVEWKGFVVRFNYLNCHVTTFILYLFAGLEMKENLSSYGIINSETKNNFFFSLLCIWQSN